MNKQGFIDEITRRGKVDLSKLPTTSRPLEWYYKSEVLARIVYSNDRNVIVTNIDLINPPIYTSDVIFEEKVEGLWQTREEFPDVWLLARIDELPFPVKKTVTFESVPAGATVKVD